MDAMLEAPACRLTCGKMLGVLLAKILLLQLPSDRILHKRSRRTR